MGIRLGNERLLWVETAVAGTFISIAGQGDFTRSRSRSAIGTATKTSGWDTERAGLSKGKADTSFIPDLPDAGYERFETLAKAEPQVPFNIQVRSGGLTGGEDDVEFACSVTVSDFEDNAAQNDVVKTKASFLYAAAPTIDTLN